MNESFTHLERERREREMERGEILSEEGFEQNRSPDAHHQNLSIEGNQVSPSSSFQDESTIRESSSRK